MTEIKRPRRYSWTNPMCDQCWWAENPARIPVTLNEPVSEVCCSCGRTTRSGIYIRRDPKDCAFKRVRDD